MYAEANSPIGSGVVTQVDLFAPQRVRIEQAGHHVLLWGSRVCAQGSMRTIRLNPLSGYT